LTLNDKFWKKNLFIFFIYLFSVNIYSYPVGNERHKVVSIIWFTKIIMAVQCESNSYEDIYNYFGEMECNTWANGGQAECTQIFIYGIYKLSHLISMINKIQLWTIHVPILFACNIWSECGWFIWWRNGVGDRGIIVYTTYHARTLLTVPYVY